MALLPEQQEIAKIVGYTPLTHEEGREPADTTYCKRPIEMVEGWPYIKFKGELYPIPTMSELEEWTFDSICTTPDEDDVEPDHPHSWLSILGMI